MNYYKYDVHVHTSETSNCGKVDAKDVVKLYKEAGYDGIVITDHYYRGFFENLEGSSWKDKVACFLEGYHNAQSEGERLVSIVKLNLSKTRVFSK